MRIVATVPAKKSSERLENKNMLVLDGEFMFKRKLRQLLACELIDEVVLDTDSDEMAALASDIAVKLLNRPASLATNATDGHELFAWSAAELPPADIYIQALCTAPFVDQDTIGRALERLLDTPEADSLVAVRTQKQYTWQNGAPNYGQGRIPNSVDLPEMTVEAMSLYMVRRPQGVPSPDRRFGTSPLLFELTKLEDVDVNNSEDLALAEQLAAGSRAVRNKRDGTLKSFINSTVLADICHEHGINAVLPQNLQPASSGKILGRAKTLKLDSLRPAPTPEERKGIYKSLDSYAFIRPGDVIVVSTEVPQRAYFGDLNATLALRSGAVGAVVDGFTRDSDDVRAMDFPVYAHGRYCADIRNEGTLGGMNMPVNIGGVDIHNDDVIFADGDGVLAIPAQSWHMISELAVKRILNEMEIKAAIVMGTENDALLDEHGDF